MTWNKNVPADNEFGSKFPAENQANMAALEDALSREHTFPGVFGTTAGQHLCGVKAAVFVTGAATPVIAYGYNVDSVTRVGQGVYTVAFTTQLVNYVVAGMASYSAGNYMPVVAMDASMAPTAASCTLLIYDIANSTGADVAFWCALFVGN